MTRATKTVVLFCVLSFMAVVPARAGDAITVPLKADKLKDPEYIISQADLSSGGRVVRTGRDDGDYYVEITDKGVVTPKRKLDFSASETEKSISIGGKDYVLSPTKQSFDGKKLKTAAGAFEPGKIKLDNGMEYTVAFPIMSGQGAKRTVYYRSGSVLKGTVEGVNLAFYDDNMDGAYSTTGDTFGLDGGLVFAPITEKFATTAGTYKLESFGDNGADVKVSKVDGATARIFVKMNGTGIEGHVAFAGDNGVSFVTLCDNRPVIVPPGKYKIVYGVLFSKKLKGVAAGITSGKMGEFDVADGAAVTINLGKEFKLGFDVSISAANKVTINPFFKLSGQSSEAYIGFTVQTSPLPLVAFSEKGDKKESPMGAFETG